MLQKKTSKKFKCEFDFALQILQIFLLFKCLWVPPLRYNCFWSVWKMSTKIAHFHLSYFPYNYFIFNWFRLQIWQQKRIWLIVFLTNLWYSFMFSYDADMTVVNYINKDVQNRFVSASDHQIFIPGPKENFTFPISFFLFIIANSYVNQREPRNMVLLIMSQLYFFLES